MSLVQHDTDLFSVEHEFGWQAGLVTIPVRMTVVRLSDGQLILHSPVPVSPELRLELEALGRVGYIIVPRAHGRFVAEVSQLFPDAQLMAAPASPSRRLKSQFQASLANQPPAAWAGELESYLVRGFRLDEVVLFHPSTRTLIITDLCFNIHHASTRLSLFFFKANGMWEYFGPSRLIRRLAVSNRVVMRESLEKVLECDFERVVPGHGDVIEHGGPDALRAAWRM